MSEDFPVLAGFRAGSLLAGYRLEAQVGAGGMAVVFRARDQRLGRLVALKILAPGLAADGPFRRRFIAESRAAAAVDDPHIIPVYEAGEADGVLFIAMRYVAGGDLRRMLEQEGPLEPGRAAGFISPVASALDAAHGAGLVHRDVKPANILVDARPARPDHVYLSDFGVSKGASSSASLTGTGYFLGTPDYSAPEQIEGRAVDGRTDQYALACVAYQLLTGSVPFERDKGIAVLAAHLSAVPPSLGSRRPGLPGAADQVLARALAKVPEKRYGSCGEFADALREALGLAPYTASIPASAPGYPRTEIALQSGVPETATARTGTAADLADLRAALTIDSVPPAAAEDGIPAAAGALSHPTGTADESGWRTREPGEPASGAGRPPSAPDALTGDRRARSGRGLDGDGARPTWRRRRTFLAITVACAILTAAVVVPLVLARSPRTPHSPGSLRSSSSQGHSRVGTVSLAAILTDPSGGCPISGAQAQNGCASLVAFSPNGKLLAAAPQIVGDAHASSIYLWNVATNSLAATLTIPDNGEGAFSVAFSPNGTMLAVADNVTDDSQWNVATKSLAATLTSPDGRSPSAIAFSPDGTMLAVAGTNYSENVSIDLWNVATKSLAATLTNSAVKDSAAGTDSVAFSPDGTMLAVGGAIGNSKGRTFLWNVTTKSQIATLTNPDGWNVNSVVFSPNGATLAAGDAGDRIVLWSVATKSLAATLTDPGGKEGAAQSVAFSPNGMMLAVGDNDGSTYLWNVATKSLAATLTNPGGWYSQFSVAFSPNGTMLAVSGYDSTYLWNTGRN